MMPGVNAGALKNAQIDEKQMDRIEAIILSMTPEERLKPEIINGSRRKRIAKGCGLGVEDVNRLLKQFEQMKKMMKQFASMGGKGAKRMPFGKMKIPFG
jgi:signal recognition particle subunit SRP54